MAARWLTIDEVSRIDADLPDELDAFDVVVVEGVDAATPCPGWAGSGAPCVVIASVSNSLSAPAWADVVLDRSEGDRLEGLVAAVEANPRAARVLVDVLRTVEELDIASGLVVESLAYSLLLGGSEFLRWLGSAELPRPRDHRGEPVHVERSGELLHITLHRPDVRNAYGASVRDALVEALRVAEVDATVRRVVVDGSGPAFCSGGDLTEFGTALDLIRAHEVRVLRSGAAAIARVAGRIGAAMEVRVHGASVGAGVELASFAPTVTASADATFRLPEVAMGLIPGAGGCVGLTRRVGRQVTAELALSGRTVTAPEALGLGLVSALT